MCVSIYVYTHTHVNALTPFFCFFVSLISLDFLLQVIHSRPGDLVPKMIDEDDPDLQRPDEETIEETTEKTREALSKLVSSQISAAMPVRHAEKQNPAQYIRWRYNVFIMSDTPHHIIYFYCQEQCIC